jgi:predicted phosphodiesterase
MRLLAFSDIHNNLVAVRKLRAQEENSFDAIVVAGDIGNASAAGCFEILATFKCPVVYVYGNWDHELSYENGFGSNCHLIQSSVVTVGDINFTGFSGCPTNWGKNPIAQKIHRKIELENKGVVDALQNRTSTSGEIRGTKAHQEYQLRLQSAESEILQLNRESVGKAIQKAGIDPRKSVVVTHERLARLSEEIPGALLHLFGHLHQFSERIFKATKYVNVAALDRPVSARPRARQKWREADCRNFNAGNYTTIEINSSRAITVRCLFLAHDYPNWIPLKDRRYNGIEWIPEEATWTNASDPPLALRTTRIAKPHVSP